MSNLSQVQVGSTTYDLRDYHKTGVYFVRGSHTTNTNDWEGTLAGVSELYDGLTIAYYLNRMGEGNVTLNLTLADNTTTGKINCYLGETRLSTQYIPGMIIFLTYLASSNRGAAATDTTYSDFTGATASAAGAHGLVPQPASGSNTKYLKGNGSWDAVDGDDVSVSITGTYINGTPVLNSALATLDGAIATVNGQLTGKQDKFANQSANKVFAGPSSGNAAAPSFRSLVEADIPGLAASKISSGTLATARGGVPTGGTIGQVLTKTSNTNNAVKWTTPFSIEDLKAPLTLQDSSLTIGTAPTVNAYPKELIFTDSADQKMGYLQANNQTDQGAFTIGASLPDDSSQNQIALGYNRSNNTPYIYVSQPTAFRNAIRAAASSHNHAASNITSGVLATARGGVPTGGTTGQVLTKTSDTNNAVEWATPQSSTEQSTYYGTCATAAGTAAKVVTCDGYKLKPGNLISILFTVANTAAAPTLNINSTTAKSVYVGAAVASVTNSCKWSANTLVTFIYDGRYYRYLNQVAANTVENGGSSWYGTSSTVAATAAKVVACENFRLVAGARISVLFSAANTAAVPTLNVNSTGAKAIGINNAVTSATNTLYGDANELVEFIYDGTRFRHVASAATTAEIDEIINS